MLPNSLIIPICVCVSNKIVYLTPIYAIQPPQKNFKWNGTLDTTNDPQECVQGSLIVTGNEDCLYINVYVPKVV